MADQFTSLLRLRKQEVGANSNSWGTLLNTLLDLVDVCISGMSTISTTGGTYTLSTADGTTDEARYAMLKVTGTLVSNSTIVVPASTKSYIVWNGTSGSYTCTVKTSGGTGIAVTQGKVMILFCDGTNVLSAITELQSPTISGATLTTPTITVQDNILTIQDNADTTKQLQFQLSGITTGTTRTLTAPDASGTLALTSDIPASVLTTIGDTIEATTAGAAARLAATATVAAHATTMDPWVARVVTLSGGAVTFTDMADADYVGQKVLLIMNAAHIFTDGAVFDVQGGANYTAAAGDQVLLVATAVDAFDVTIFPASGAPVAPVITLGTEQATTSGTSIDFTGIPAGVRRITIMFAGVSTAGGTDSVIVQLGDAGGIENTGYVSCGSVIDTAVNTASSTAGFIVRTNNASRVFSGAMVISLEDSAGFTWVETHNVIDTTASTANFCGAGIKSLSAELTQVRIALSGSDTFDAGAINISYER